MRLADLCEFFIGTSRAVYAIAILFMVHLFPFAWRQHRFDATLVNTQTHRYFNICTLTVEGRGRCVASLVIHRRDKAPLVRLGRVPLCGVLSHVSVVASHRIDTSVKYRNTHVAPAVTVSHVNPEYSHTQTRIELHEKTTRCVEETNIH